VTSVFSSAAPYIGANDTLKQALEYGGGSGTSGAAKNLLKQAVAALLNAAHSNVNFPWSVSQVISQVNAALASGDKDDMEDLADHLDYKNNLGCPLN
jgi:hypothetical protein